jgi:phospholipid/cholesterol/gamma-HCH transport system substrate-binding protein
MPRESDLEMKVGVFVVAAIVCLVAFVFSISDFSVFKKGDELKVMFRYANGLKKGSPVRVAGVDAGHIRAITVLRDAATRQSDVSVDAWLEEGHPVPVDSRFLINQLGLLGEKYLEILPGVAVETVRPGMTMRGEDPVPMETIMNTVGDLGDKVGVMVEGINRGILTPENTRSLAEILSNFAVFSAALKDSKGTVGRFLSDPAVFENMEEMTADLKQNPWKLFYRPKK